jgi:KDO2-lipid IV(A) lauroyltransferase
MTGTADKRRGFAELVHNRDFTLLWAGSLASQVGDHLNLMALTALIFTISGGEKTSGLEFSKILLLASAPVLFIGPISGVYADRISRRTLMIASDFIRAVLVAAIALVSRSMVMVYILIFLVFTINRFYLSAKSAALPQIVKRDNLMSANSLLNIAGVVAIIVGPAGGGLLVERFGFTVGFFADSATYVVSGIFVAFMTLRGISGVAAGREEELAARRRVVGEAARHALHAHSRVEFREDAVRIGHEIAAPIGEEVEVISSAYQRLVADLKDGIAQMKGHAIVIYSTVSLSSLMFVVGFVMVALPILVRNEFAMGPAQLGILLSLAGVGMLVGSVLVGHFFSRTPRRAIIAVSCFLCGAVIIGIAQSSTIILVSAGVLLMGVFVAPAMITCDTVVHETMPKESVGKAFGFRDMLSKAAFGIAGVLSGVIVDVIGPRYLLVAVGLVSMGYACISVFLLADTSRLNLLNAYPLLRVTARLAATLPRRMSYWIVVPLSDLAAYVLKTKRRYAQENAGHVLGKPPDSREAKVLARRMFRSYGRYYADFLGLGGRHRNSVSDRVRFRGLEHVQEALSAGKGVIFVSAHLGSWDMGGAAMADADGLPGLSAIVEPVSGDASDSAVSSLRKRGGVNVIRLGQTLKVWRALRRNEIVFVLGERLVGADGVDVEFFGKRTVLPRGAAYLALRSGAPIVPGFCIRRSDGSYELLIERPIETDAGDDFDAAVKTYTQRLAGIIERYIGRYPDQWCMLQPIWAP